MLVLTELGHWLVKVSVHFFEANTAAMFPSLCGLPRRAILVLIADRVPQTLVIDDANVQMSLELPAVYAAVHGFIAVVIVSCFISSK